MSKNQTPIHKNKQEKFAFEWNLYKEVILEKLAKEQDNKPRDK